VLLLWPSAGDERTEMYRGRGGEGEGGKRGKGEARSAPFRLPPPWENKLSQAYKRRRRKDSGGVTSRQRAKSPLKGQFQPDRKKKGQGRGEGKRRGGGGSSYFLGRGEFVYGE